MISTTRLHRHEYDLLPPDTGKLISVMVELLSNGSMLDEKHPSYHEIQLRAMFNFSLPEAFDIIIEHKKKVNEIFLPHIECFLIVAYGILIAWGVLANCLVGFVVTKQCSRKTITNNGPSPRNLYIVNLAIADLLLCVICMPFTLLSLLKRPWTMGMMMCKLVPVLQGANIMVSSGTITAIAFDRYFTIVRSPRGSICRFSVASTLFLIWLISFVAMVPLVLFQQIEVVRIGNLVLYEVCLEKWPSPRMQQIYTITLTTFQFIFPVVVLSAVHLKISLYLQVHLSGPKQSAFCKRASRELRRNRRTMWILSCIAIVFAISWLPLTIYTIVIEFGFYKFPSPESLYLWFCGCHLLAMSSSGTNPLLYGYLNTNFRRDITNLYYKLFRIDGVARRIERRRSLAQRQDGKQQREARSQNTNAEPYSVVVRSRDRRTSSSFGTTLTTTFRTRSSSCGITQSKIDEI